MHKAAVRGHQECVQVLLGAGADKDAKDEVRHYPLPGLRCPMQEGDEGDEGLRVRCGARYYCRVRAGPDGTSSGGGGRSGHHGIAHRLV